MTTNVAIYDTTLRDGTQGEGFQLSVPEKLQVTELLDELGVAYIEGGWPGSNPRDEAFFREARALRLRTSRLAAFGATHRAGVTCDDDPSVQALVRAETPVITIFGKSSRFQATEVLGISPARNLEIIRATVGYLKARCDEVIYDAEHFFDGAEEDVEYAMQTLQAAVDGGADWLVLCDTNGGTLPRRVAERVAAVRAAFDVRVGIHTHNDAELAVANSIAAVEQGAAMVQGTVNGWGERCGNANLISIVPTLELKMGIRCLPEGQLAQLTRLSRTVDEISNYVPLASQPYVGRSAFAHKGGVHVNAVMKNPRSYEHIEPELVGNERRVLVSDLSGRSNVVAKARQFGLELDPDDPRTQDVLQRVKQMEHAGYQFDGAEASLRLLMEAAHGDKPTWFEVRSACVTTELATVGDQQSVARVRVDVGGEESESSAEGNGPVHALGTALRQLLERHYPGVGDVRLVDYKVRILSSGDGIAAVVRVLVRASDGKRSWGTVGVSTNVIEASWRALVDAFETKLLNDGVPEMRQVAAE
jgi:2-isopropylmalate synthase